jgi:hypothetical protein
MKWIKLQNLLVHELAKLWHHLNKTDNLLCKKSKAYHLIKFLSVAPQIPKGCHNLIVELRFHIYQHHLPLLQFFTIIQQNGNACC